MGPEEGLKFALVLEVDVFGNPNIRVQNHGIPLNDLLLYLSVWVKHMQRGVQDNIRDNFFKSE